MGETITEFQEKQATKRYWFVIDVVLYLFLVFFVLFFLLWPYYCGRMKNLLLVVPNTCITILLFPAFATIFIIRSILVWPKYIKEKARRLRTHLIAYAALILCFLLVVFLFPTFTFVAGFKHQIKKEADVPLIRNWLMSLDEKYFPDEHGWPYDKNRDDISLPEPTDTWNLSYVTFDKREGYRTVDFEWGGPFGRWGFVVGPEDMLIPPSEIDGRFRKKIEDGAYIWVK